MDQLTELEQLRYNANVGTMEQLTMRMLEQWNNLQCECWNNGTTYNANVETTYNANVGTMEQLTMRMLKQLTMRMLEQWNNLQCEC